jgi:nucleoside-diphosphate-sugar epimerase
MVNFVLGGSGFIGSVLCKTLEKLDQSFIILDKVEGSQFSDRTNIVDIRNIALLEESISSNSCIINLAAEHADDVNPIDLYYEVNVEGAKNICLVAEKKNITTIVFVSSVAIYGFAKLGADESAEIKPFNDYGLSKYQAEIIYENWQKQDPDVRCLVIIRPTVVFGEGNRGNVYRLLKQIISKKFIQIGDGKNKKSLAYVGNVAAFIVYCISNYKKGIHIFNYVDKPDWEMKKLIEFIRCCYQKYNHNKNSSLTIVNLSVPKFLGLAFGKFLDFFGQIFGIKFSVSEIRVRKFCSNSTYSSKYEITGFQPPFSLEKALERTIKHEFNGLEIRK